jgi:hypothetical protein
LARSWRTLPEMRAGPLALLAVLTAACSSSREQSLGPADATGDASDNPETCTGTAGPSRTSPACANGSTSISGTVYDPANVNPLYNVTVYIPRATLPLPALPDGASCNSCSDLYSTPLAAAVTDATGHFSIFNAPDGSNIPLVVQTGKWRMAYSLANVVACQDNPQPDHMLHLPKSHLEGNLPNIAISTGAGDSLECLPLRIGIDPGEYTGGAGGSGRLHVFTGYMGAVIQGGTSPDPGTTLWDSDMDINQFDVVLLSCEGQETVNMNQKVLWDYANGGGHVFASHFHYAWFNFAPHAIVAAENALAAPPAGRASPPIAASPAPATGPLAEPRQSPDGDHLPPVADGLRCQPTSCPGHHEEPSDDIRHTACSNFSHVVCQRHCASRAKMRPLPRAAAPAPRRRRARKRGGAVLWTPGAFAWATEAEGSATQSHAARRPPDAPAIPHRSTCNHPAPRGRRLGRKGCSRRHA